MIVANLPLAAKQFSGCSSIHQNWRYLWYEKQITFLPAYPPVPA
jgi:hypothetical protein